MDDVITSWARSHPKYEDWVQMGKNRTVMREILGRLRYPVLEEYLCVPWSVCHRPDPPVYEVDNYTGHMVCSTCSKIEYTSGLKKCELCSSSFINLSRNIESVEDICPRCVEENGFQDVYDL